VLGRHVLRVQVAVLEAFALEREETVYVKNKHCRRLIAAVDLMRVFIGRA
jgi:hypothetical protein